ncbi:MAG: helix-turn-helix transcriptional regulator [Deinococcales bacterium]
MGVPGGAGTGLGEQLRQVASLGTQGNRVARAIAFLKTHYRQPLRVEDHAASAAFHVGYESPSQFSREFQRTFGPPPARHVSAILRAS